MTKKTLKTNAELPPECQKQDYEKTSEYALFRDYYLTQSAPRSVTVAYKEYRRIKHIRSGKSAESFKPPKQAAGSFRALSQGKRVIKGVLIEIDGSMSWRERAEKFDEAQRVFVDEQLLSMRLDQIKAELDATDKLGELLNTMLVNAPAFLVQTTDVHKEGNETVITKTVELNANEAKNLAALLKEWMQQRRLIFGLPQSTPRQVDVANAGGTPFSVLGRGTLDAFNAAANELRQAGYLNDDESED